MNLPKSLSIGGRRIRVSYHDEQPEAGRYYHTAKQITLDPDHPEIKETLLHEAMHAALAVSGLSEVLGDKLEEAVCRAVELLAPNVYFKTPKAKQK